MSQTVWTENICDRCGRLERVRGITPEQRLPDGWARLNGLRYWSDPFSNTSSEVTLCSDCKTKFNDEWMKPAKNLESPAAEETA